MMYCVYISAKLMTGISNVMNHFVVFGEHEFLLEFRLLTCTYMMLGVGTMMLASPRILS